MTVTALPNGLFDVASESDPEKSYVVSLSTVSCTCPDWRARRNQKELDDPERRCKHMRATESQPQPTKLERAAAKAKTLNDNELTYYAARYAGEAAGAACLLEMATRLAAARCALDCEPRPIPAGVLALLQGATEAERERALAIYR